MTEPRDRYFWGRRMAFCNGLIPTGLALFYLLPRSFMEDSIPEFRAAAHVNFSLLLGFVGFGYYFVLFHMRRPDFRRWLAAFAAFMWVGWNDSYATWRFFIEGGPLVPFPWVTTSLQLIAFGLMYPSKSLLARWKHVPPSA